MPVSLSGNVASIYSSLCLRTSFSLHLSPPQPHHKHVIPKSVPVSPDSRTPIEQRRHLRHVRIIKNCKTNFQTKFLMPGRTFGAGPTGNLAEFFPGKAKTRPSKAKPTASRQLTSNMAATLL